MLHGRRTSKLIEDESGRPTAEGEYVNLAARPGQTEILTCQIGVAASQEYAQVGHFKPRFLLSGAGELTSI